MHSDTKWILQQVAIGAALAAYVLAGTAIIIATCADSPRYFAVSTNEQAQKLCHVAKCTPVSFRNPLP